MEDHVRQHRMADVIVYPPTRVAGMVSAESHVRQNRSASIVAIHAATIDRGRVAAEGHVLQNRIAAMYVIHPTTIGSIIGVERHTKKNRIAHIIGDPTPTTKCSRVAAEGHIR